MCVAVCVHRVDVIEDEIPADMRAEAKERRQEMIGKSVSSSYTFQSHIIIIIITYHILNVDCKILYPYCQFYTHIS